MTSKRHEVDTPNLWFPSRLAPETIMVHYSKRGRALEITPMGRTIGPTFLAGQTFRITMYDFLRGLGADDLARCEADLIDRIAARKAAQVFVPMVREFEAGR